ncbi:MAG: CHAT domain-containing protein [Chthonomonas sp.]|nr:CHAT domain-containing protein [Chthonomonas sp.]
MSPDEFLNELESGTLEISALAPSGAAALLFDRVLQQYGIDSSKATQLANEAKKYRWPREDQCHIIRTQALGHYCAGRWQKASAQFQRAADLQSGPDAGSFAIPAIDALARLGKVDEALALGKALIKRLGANSVMAARARVNVGNIYEQIDELRPATREYLAAVDGLTGTSYALDLGKAHAGATNGLIAVGNFAEARKHAEASIKIFQEAGQAMFAAVASANLALIEVAQGRADVALPILTSSRDALPDWRTPWLDEIVGDALFALNLWPDAESSYLRALAHDEMRPKSVGYANCMLGVGCALDAMGRHRDALPWLTRSRRRHLALGNRAMAAASSLLTSEILLRDGKAKSAKLRAEAAEQEARAAGFKLLADRCLLAIANCNLKLKSPDPVLHKAVLKLKSSPSVGLRWRAWLYQVNTSTGAARRNAQRKLVDEVLRSRLAVRSTAARLGFLADKQAALQEVLLELLTSSRSQDHQTAREILLKTRSITLIDEIESALSDRSQGWLADLAQIRTQISENGFGDDLNMRRLSISSLTTSLPKIWADISGRGLDSISAQVGTTRQRCDMYVCTPRSIFVMRESGRVDNLRASPMQLTRLLNQVRFELSDPGQPAERALDVLCELGSMLRPAAENPKISPDALLWSVPWAAFDASVEPILYLSPAFIATTEMRLPAHPNVVVWAGDSRRLPQIEAEVELLRKSFESVKVCRSRTEALESMQSASIDLLHVAAHGVHEPNNPMMSSIYFPDGRLFAAEVATSSMRVKFAVLLSCESGKLTSVGGAEPNGWVRGFLARGAQAALATGWQIEDLSALTLARELYQHWSAGAALPTALRTARNAMREKYSHPFFWASPILFGGYHPVTMSMGNEQ